MQSYQEIFKKVEAECLKMGRVLTSEEMKDKFNLAFAIARDIQPKIRQKHPELPFLTGAAKKEQFDLENGNNPEIKKRKCLSCRKEFISSHFGHRVCSICKSQGQWVSEGMTI